MIEVISKYLIAMTFMIACLLFWFMVQKLSRKVATEHPEFGKAREEGGGCGGGGKCNCTSIKHCINPKIKAKKKLKS
ncbi:MAG: chemotaxis protein [Pseudomonadota bacterium]